jgi:ribosomal protein S18 acetylase RimI-like enzyme
MSIIRYAQASALSLDAVADLYTRTFADYYYAAHITTDLMVMFQRVEQINLDFSPVQYVDDEAVGLATVGLRGTQACCKGFGVVAPFRGRGLAEPLSMEVIRQARLAGARTLQLGVLKHNERAVRTYFSTGYKVTRDLLSFEWTQGDVDPASAAGQSIKFADAFVTLSAAKDVLQHFARLHPAQPSWGHDLPALRAMDGLQALASYDGARLNGYILYQPGGADQAQVQDVAADSVELGAALLRALQPRFARLYRHNETADSAMVPAFVAAGFRETMQRYEMKLEL